MPVFCKNCKYREEVHLMHGSIIEHEECGKTVTVTAPETFYSRQQKKQLSVGRISMRRDRRTSEDPQVPFQNNRVEVLTELRRQHGQI